MRKKDQDWTLPLAAEESPFCRLLIAAATTLRGLKFGKKCGQRDPRLLNVTELMLPPLAARTGLLYFALAAGFFNSLGAQFSPTQAAEYPISGALLGDQKFPAVSVSPTGGYLVWEDNRVDGNHGSGIAGIGLDASLHATGTVFRVNQQLPGNQEKPQVLRFNDGNLLFAWENRNGAKPGVYTRVLSPDGSFLTGDILVNTPSWIDKIKQSVTWSGHFRNKWKQRKFKFREKLIHSREQAGNVALAALADGSAVIAYQVARKSETNTWRLVPQVRSRNDFTYSTNEVLRPTRHYGDLMQDVFFQRVSSTGEKLGPEVLVNQYVDFNQRNPAVAVLPNGNFVVTWVCESRRGPDRLSNPSPLISAEQTLSDNFRVRIVGRLFHGQGEPVGNEFAISSADDLVQANPAVAALANGGFTVVWSQQETLSRRWDVQGRAFDANGSASGTSFLVNAYTAGDQFAPRIVSLGDQQMAVWTSLGQDGSREGVYGRSLIAGALAGEELQLNHETISRQIHPMVATDGQSRFLTVWASFVGETGFDLFGLQNEAPLSTAPLLNAR
jgi:hypothetical protein